MGLIVDTGVFILIERSGSTTGFDVGADTVSVSAITMSELRVGAHRAIARLVDSAAWISLKISHSTLSQFAFTTDTARVHARLHADLQMRGQLIGAHDLLIAATAVEHGMAVLTTNRREFDRVPGLKVIEFPRPRGNAIAHINVVFGKPLPDRRGYWPRAPIGARDGR